MDKSKEEQPAIPELVGIDVENGLGRVGGNSKLYRELLGLFSRDFVDYSKQIETAIADGDQELAASLTHTIQGASGNIGAQNLHRASGKLESALKNNKQIDNLLKDFNESLEEVLTSLAGMEVDQDDER